MSKNPWNQAFDVLPQWLAMSAASRQQKAGEPGERAARNAATAAECCAAKVGMGAGGCTVRNKSGCSAAMASGVMG